MLKMTIDNEEVVSDKDITINEEMLSASSTILNNVYPKEWEEDKDYTSRFYYPQDYSKALIQRSYVTQEAEAGTTIQVNGSATLTDVDTTKNSRVLRLLGQTSQTGTPTPSLPIPVNVVSGDNEIIIKGNGKNLFNKDFHIINGSFINGSGGISSDSTLSYQDYFIEVEQNTDYTISSSVSTIYRIAKYNSNKTFINRPYNENPSTSYTINTGNAKYIKMAGTLTSALDSLQIEKGSSASNFEPYIGNTYNIDLPVENLFDKSTNIISNKGLTTTGGTFDSDTVSTKDFLEVQPNTTYTYSGYDDTSVRKRVCMYSSNSEASFLQESSGTNATLTFTTTSTTKYIRFQFKTSEINNVQLEKGSKANSYTPYGTTPIELCKIGNYQDYIYKDSDKWYLHKEIGKYIFGSTNLAYDSTYNRAYTNVSSIINNILIPTSNSEILNGLSNYFSTLNATTFLGNTSLNGLAISSTGTLSLRNTSYTTQTDYNNWLSTNKPILYYALATSTNTEITYTELLNQLNALSSQ